MPHVASETKSHAVKYSQPRAQSAPAPDRSPNGAFESMLDDNASAAADRSQRAEDTARTAPSQKSAPPDKAKSSKPTGRADRADDARPADQPKEKEAKAETADADDDAEAADKPVAESKEMADSVPVDIETDAQPADTTPAPAVDLAALFAVVEAAVTPVPEQPQADAEAQTAKAPAEAPALPALPAAPAVVTAAVVEEAAALPAAAANAKAKPDFAKLESKEDGEADDEQTIDEALVQKAANAQADAKPVHTAATNADKEQIAQARGETPAHAQRHQADAAPAVQADASAPAPKAPEHVAPQLLPAQTHALSNPTAAAAVAAAQPAQVARQEPALPLNGVAVEIASKASEGKNRFEIRLDPPELGRIDVRLDVDKNGHVTSRLIVDRQDTLDLLRRDASGLERALQDAGLKTSDNGLQFSLRDQFASQQERQSGGEQARLVVDDDALPVIEAAQNYGRLAAARGGLDIRV